MVLRFQVSNQFDEIHLSEISTTPGAETEFRYFLNSVRMDDKRILAIEVWDNEGPKS